jgi:hypothetical protein
MRIADMLFRGITALTGRRSPRRQAMALIRSSSNTTGLTEGQEGIPSSRGPSPTITDFIERDCPKQAIKCINWGEDALSDSKIKEAASIAIARGQADTLDALAARYPDILTANFISKAIGSEMHSDFHYNLLQADADGDIRSPALTRLLTAEPKPDSQLTLLPDDSEILRAFVNKAPMDVPVVVAVRGDGQYDEGTRFFTIQRTTKTPASENSDNMLPNNFLGVS